MNAEIHPIKTAAEAALAANFAAAKGALPGAGAVAALREEAFRRFESDGLPHRRVEEWKYTDLRALMRDAKPLAGVPDAAAKAHGRNAAAALLAARPPQRRGNAPGHEGTYRGAWRSLRRRHLLVPRGECKLSVLAPACLPFRRKSRQECRLAGAARRDGAACGFTDGLPWVSLRFPERRNSRRARPGSRGPPVHRPQTFAASLLSQRRNHGEEAPVGARWPGAGRGAKW